MNTTEPQTIPAFTLSPEKRATLAELILATAKLRQSRQVEESKARVSHPSELTAEAILQLVRYECGLPERDLNESGTHDGHRDFSGEFCFVLFDELVQEPNIARALEFIDVLVCNAKHLREQWGGPAKWRRFIVPAITIDDRRFSTCAAVWESQQH